MHRTGRIKFLFLLPASLWVLCFTIFPLAYGVRLSLYDVDPGGPDTFVGLDHYARFFREDRAIQSAVVTLVFVVCGVTLQMCLGMALAVLFSRPMALRGLWRAILTLPLFATPMAVGLLFITVFYEEGGLVNGLLPLKIPWLSDPTWAVVSVVIVDVWQWTPFCFLIFLAALQGIPQDYYEAAHLETASGASVFRHVTLPILQPTIVLVGLLRIVEAFKIFDIPYTLTNGGPGTATQVATMYAYFEGVRFRNYGYAASISILLFTAVMVGIVFTIKRIRQAYKYA